MIRVEHEKATFITEQGGGGGGRRNEEYEKKQTSVRKSQKLKTKGKTTKGQRN